MVGGNTHMRKGYSKIVVHSSCLDTFCNNMKTTNTESLPGNHYKSSKLPKLELYSVVVSIKATGVHSPQSSRSICCVCIEVIKQGSSALSDDCVD